MIGLPPPTGSKNWQQWGERLNAYLGRQWNKLSVRRGDENASDDGILMWDRSLEHAVVSVDGEFQPLSYGYNAFGAFYNSSNISASSSNTATAISWTGTMQADQIDIDNTNTSRLVFNRKGRYHIIFECQINGGSGSTKTIRFWFRKNGTDIANSARMVTVHDSSAITEGVAFTVVDVDQDDYVEVMFAVSNTGLTLSGESATAYSPAVPSVTVDVIEVNAG